ncbi:hypothetical protein WA026_000547 [Henosepilachna vigintioctopunctata]
MMKTTLLSALFIVYVQAICDKELVRPLEWTGGSFEWPNLSTKALYKSSGRFIGKNNIATRAQIYKDDVIVAFPRYKPGIPVTLGKVCLKQRNCEAVISPFPDWSSQEEGNSAAFQSVVDLFIDNNEILWILDVGVVNTLNSPVRKSPPRVIAFNLRANKQARILDLSGLVAQASRLQYLAVEYAPDGRPFVYISDAATRSLLVFDVAGNRGYRVVLPKAVVGCGRRDVLYIALVQKGCGNNFIIFTYLSSPRIFSIRTDYLRAGSASGKIQDIGVKPNRAVILGTDLGSAIFFRYEGQSEIYRWDTNTPFLPANFVLVYKSDNCFLATQAVADLRRERMRVLESNFPDYVQDTVGCGATQKLSLMTGCL